jgi:SHAQKYF class myb-like DNA-binding protein
MTDNTSSNLDSFAPSQEISGNTNSIPQTANQISTTTSAPITVSKPSTILSRIPTTNPSTIPAKVATVTSGAPSIHPAATATPTPLPLVASTVPTSSAYSINRAEQQSSPKSSSLSSKKKKQVIPMATAQSATATTAGENTGRWTGEEHRLFLQGLEEHGKGWKKIASLIKSRTVVQIRTHAQKYFQKLSKARQNGEDVVSMENRVERFVVSNHAKRKRSGTKRKAIASVVASAERESKRVATSDKKSGGHGKHPSSVRGPGISPALAPYILSVDLPNNPIQKSDGTSASNGIAPSVMLPSITTVHGTISGSALEDSLFRFLSPLAVETPNSSSDNVNDVARQAGANPITVPSADVIKSSQGQFGGDVSPTGITDFPQNWAWETDPPSWFSRGADVDELLDEADALDWLADSGDLSESYFPPPEHTVHKLNTLSEPSLMTLADKNVSHESGVPAPVPDLETSMDVSGNSASLQNIPALFENANNLIMKKTKSMNMSSTSLFATATEAADAVAADDQFHLFDAHLDEQAFVTALLDHSSDSQNNLKYLHHN